MLRVRRDPAGLAHPGDEFSGDALDKRFVKVQLELAVWAVDHNHYQWRNPLCGNQVVNDGWDRHVGCEYVSVEKQKEVVGFMFRVIARRGVYPDLAVILEELTMPVEVFDAPLRYPRPGQIPGLWRRIGHLDK